jgi:chemotaxis protein MotB
MSAWMPPALARASRWAALCVMIVPGCGWKKEIEGLEALVAARESVIEGHLATIASLEADVASLERQRDEARARISELESRLATREADLARMDGQLAEEREKSARVIADKSAKQAEIEGMKKALAELAERKRQAEERVRQFKELVGRFQALIDAGTLDVRMVDGRMVLVLATDVLFASGSADLSAQGGTALAEVAAILAAMPDKRFQVEGHTDNVPIASSRFPNNWYLAASRAIGVVEHLVTSGMAATQLSAASFGDTRPVASNDDKTSRAVNRRIEIVIVPDLSELPGYDELNRL